jgi:hypothetical protein
MRAIIAERVGGLVAFAEKSNHWLRRRKEGV